MDIVKSTLLLCFGKFSKYESLLLAYLIIPILFLAFVVSADSSGESAAGPSINELLINREVLYRGLQTLSVLANITDPAFPPEKLRVFAELMFSDGLTLKKDLVFLLDAKVFDVRIPVPSSAGLGPAILKVVAVNPLGLNSTKVLTINIIDHTPVMELREATLMRKLIMESIVGIAGINNTAYISDLAQAVKLIDEADISIKTLEDVDRGISLYREAQNILDKVMKRVIEDIDLASKVRNSLADLNGNISMIKILLKVLESQGYNTGNLSANIRELEIISKEINKLYQEGSFVKALLRISDVQGRVDLVLSNLLSLVRSDVIYRNNISSIWNTYFNASSYYFYVKGREEILRSLGIVSSEVDYYLRNAERSLTLAYGELVAGSLRASIYISDAIGNLSIAITALDQAAKGYIELTLRYVDTIIGAAKGRPLRPDTSYLESLVKMSRESLGRGDYVAAAAYSNMAIQEAARISAILSNQETWLVVLISILMAGLIALIISLVFRRPKISGST
ncbi:MAG: hypothetical protein RQ885_03955 [Desulfurococcales archaeon]|jgi:hypothetical protein|nr:hypothetical protein [Desulfurococcales archaeon]